MTEEENKIYYCPECGDGSCKYKGVYGSAPYYECVRCKRCFEIDEITKLIRELK